MRPPIEPSPRASHFLATFIAESSHRGDGCVISVRILPRQVIDNVGHFLYLAYFTCFLHALAKTEHFLCAEKDFLKRLERENTIYFERITHDRITHRVGAHVVGWRGTSWESYSRRFVAIETYYSSYLESKQQQRMQAGVGQAGD